jgi:hypothetical protein
MTTRLCTARKPRRCDIYRCPNTIRPGELYVRHVTFPGEEGNEDGARPIVCHECEVCVNRRGEWVRDRYGVQVRLGDEVKYGGTPAKVVNFTGGHLMLLLPNGRHVMTHPRYDVTYGEAS